MNKPLLSVIVPAYNAEDHLERCLESVFAGRRAGLEVIVVDDGSSDQTTHIAERFAQQFPELVIVRQSNRGLSGARNVGLHLARGEFGLFLDSDDEVDISTVFESLLPKAQEDHLDVVLFDTVAYSFDSELEETVTRYNRFYSRDTRSEEEDLRGNRLLQLLVDSGNYLPSACLYLWRRHHVYLNGLEFHEGKIHEDNAFSFALFAATDKVAYLPVSAHRRLIRSDSLSQSASPDEAFEGYLAAYLDAHLATTRLQAWRQAVIRNLRRHVELTCLLASEEKLAEVLGGLRRR